VCRFQRDLGPEIGRRQHRDNFKRNKIIPTAPPSSQRFWIGRFHQLEATKTGGVHPACVINHTVRQHPAVAPEPLADGLRFAILEALNQHPPHEGDCSRSF
jgi:hypothetical protein